MESTPALSQRRNSIGPAASSGTGVGCKSPVCVGAVDEAGLSDEALSARLGLIGRCESRLAAMKSRVLAEVGNRHSTATAVRVAGEELRSSRRETKRAVETAQQMRELPATSDALDDGTIPQGHARLIGRAAGEGVVDEEELVAAAKREDYDEFRKTVQRHQQDRSADDGQAILDRQRKRRKATIFESPETGMFVLSAQFDRVMGTRLATALTAKERELWHREDPKARRTPQQRMADALAALVCEPGSGKNKGADLLVIADYDVVKQELVNARLADGSPIPLGELRSLALTANILPSIFDAKTQEMWLGRRRRTASEAQRVALTARDQGCVCCKANPLWCRAHHIIWWSNGGPTDLDNLLLVCDACHKKIHELGWQVFRDPKTHKYQLKPPTSRHANTKSRARADGGADRGPEIDPEIDNGPETSPRHDTLTDFKEAVRPHNGIGAITIRLPRSVISQCTRALGPCSRESVWKRACHCIGPSDDPSAERGGSTTHPLPRHESCSEARAPPRPRSFP